MELYCGHCGIHHSPAPGDADDPPRNIDLTQDRYSQSEDNPALMTTDYLQMPGEQLGPFRNPCGHLFLAFRVLIKD